MEYDENGDASDARLMAETTLPHLIEGKVIFDDVPDPDDETADVKESFLPLDACPLVFLSNLLFL